jgi:hypothetical protein
MFSQKYWGKNCAVHNLSQKYEGYIYIANIFFLKAEKELHLCLLIQYHQVFYER